MKHTVTLEESDIKDAVRKHVEAQFPGYTAVNITVLHNVGHGPMERSNTTIRADLGRPPNSKD